eukprot:11862438-Ditylum_brightwellii.AAC.1
MLIIRLSKGSGQVQRNLAVERALSLYVDEAECPLRHILGANTELVPDTLEIVRINADLSEE